MYKYTIGPNTSISIKTPKVSNVDEIKIHRTKHEDRIENHSIYPNGLDLFFIQYADKIELISNKPIVVDEKTQIKFED